MNDVERYHRRVKKRMDMKKRIDYGVKGMKRGQRKVNKVPNSSVGFTAPPKQNNEKENAFIQPKLPKVSGGYTVKKGSHTVKYGK